MRHYADQLIAEREIHDQTITALANILPGEIKSRKVRASAPGPRGVAWRMGKGWKCGVIAHTLANHDARVELTCVESGVSGRVHRLDQCMRNIPAKLFDYRALTLKAGVQTDLAGIFAIIGHCFPPAVRVRVAVADDCEQRFLSLTPYRRRFGVGQSVFRRQSPSWRIQVSPVEVAIRTCSGRLRSMATIGSVRAGGRFWPVPVAETMERRQWRPLSVEE